MVLVLHSDNGMISSHGLSPYFWRGPVRLGKFRRKVELVRAVSMAYTVLPSALDISSRDEPVTHIRARSRRSSSDQIRPLAILSNVHFHAAAQITPLRLWAYYPASVAEKFKHLPSEPVHLKSPYDSGLTGRFDGPGAWTGHPSFIQKLTPSTMGTPSP